MDFDGVFSAGEDTDGEEEWETVLNGASVHGNGAAAGVSGDLEITLDEGLLSTDSCCCTH